MSVLRAGNTTLEDGKVRICVPIAYETENEILEESVRIGKAVWQILLSGVSIGIRTCFSQEREMRLQKNS